MEHTRLENLIYNSTVGNLKGLSLRLQKKNTPIGYPTLLNFHRGYKLENIRKRVRGKFGAQIEKGRNGRLYFPNRPIKESTDYWVKKVNDELDIKIDIIESIPCEENFCNVFFKILTKRKRIQYIPDEITKKKIAKIFKVSPNEVYEDRSKYKD